MQHVKMTYTIIDQDSWLRSEHLKFFNSLSHPWYNICVSIDVTKLYHHCKQHEYRFTHVYLYLLQKVLNQYEPMRYRLVGDELRLYQEIQISTTALARDETIRFCEIPYSENLSNFSKNALETEQKMKDSKFTLEQFLGEEILQNTVHLTILPWLDFTSISHARDTRYRDSIPKIAFGKLTDKAGVISMPLSIEVHHGLMDGLHVGRFIDALQALYNQPEENQKLDVD